jgi:transcriptional regulator with GAF, ATPase, and Fis domain
LWFEFPTKAARRSSAVNESAAESAELLTREAWKRREFESITKALQKSGGKIFGPGGAAELLGMKPTTLASRIKALGLNRNAMA